MQPGKCTIVLLCLLGAAVNAAVWIGFLRLAMWLVGYQISPMTSAIFGFVIALATFAILFFLTQIGRTRSTPAVVKAHRHPAKHAEPTFIATVA